VVTRTYTTHWDITGKSGGQDDIIIFARDIVPAVLANNALEDGMFPSNGVLATIEIKSRCTKSDYISFLNKCQKMIEVSFVQNPELKQIQDNNQFLYNKILASSEPMVYNYFISLSGKFSPKSDIIEKNGDTNYVGFCNLASVFFARLAGQEQPTFFSIECNSDYERLAYFVAVVTETAVKERIRRTGGHAFLTYESGVGNFIALPKKLLEK
jgi:hypothetical protein